MVQGRSHEFLEAFPKKQAPIKNPTISTQDLRPLIQLASLGVFHLGQLQLGLSESYATAFQTTWSFKRQCPNPRLPSTNIWPLHYFLRLYQAFPILQLKNYTYYSLCCAFDQVLSCKLIKEAAALCYLSGCGLWAGRKFRKKNGRPVVVESGSTHTDWQNRVVSAEFLRNGIATPLFPEIYRRRVRDEFREADWIQIPTRFVAKTYLEAGIDERKLLVAAYGTDTKRFHCRKKADQAEKFRIICPSGVNLRKGARILVEAWRKLGWKDAELHWVGQPSRETRHLFDPVLPGLIWHPHMDQEQLAALYRSCDVMVLPSFEEGFARVLIESAASGLALVATPNSGVEEFFSPNQPEGWLIPAGSVDALCAALEAARLNRERTFSLGQRAALRAQEGFSQEAYGKRVRANFLKILGR